MRKYNEDKNRFLARTAAEAKRYSVTRRALVSLLLCLVIVSAILYIVSLLYSRFGSFTVSVNKFDANKYSLILSETPDFNDKLIRLNAKAAENITNISVNDLPADLSSVNGSHNGKNYLAYTYYLKNIGDDTVTYEYYMFIANVKNDVDTAARIRIYRDGEPVTYARTRSDGGGAEAGTEEFLTTRSVARVQVKNFKPGDVTKFTVVIWIEGDDPDCVDKLIGGSLKSDMNISVIEAKNAETASK